MDDPEELLHQVGAYELEDAKRVTDALEKSGIAFELETDESALHQLGREALVGLGAAPEGARLLVFVRESDLPRATETVAALRLG